LITGAAGTILWNRLPVLAGLISARFAAFAIAPAAAVLASLSAPSAPLRN